MMPLLCVQYFSNMRKCFAQGIQGLWNYHEIWPSLNNAFILHKWLLIHYSPWCRRNRSHSCFRGVSLFPMKSVRVLLLISRAVGSAFTLLPPLFLCVCFYFIVLTQAKTNKGNSCTKPPPFNGQFSHFKKWSENNRLMLVSWLYWNVRFLKTIVFAKARSMP